MSKSYKGVPLVVIKQVLETTKLVGRRSIPDQLYQVGQISSTLGKTELTDFVLDNPEGGQLLRDAIAHYTGGGLPDGATDELWDN